MAGQGFRKRIAASYDEYVAVFIAKGLQPIPYAEWIKYQD